MKNFYFKLMAGVFAVLLFFLVNSRNNSTVISLFVPVEINNLPEGKTIIYPRIKQARVTFQGPSFKLTEVASAALVFKVDLPENISSSYHVVLNQDLLNRRISRSVEVLSIEPGDFELVLDNLVKKKVPVEVTQLGKLNENLKLVDIEVTPAKVDISGPETELMNVKNIVTYPVDLRTIREDASLELALRAPGPLSKALVNKIAVLIKVISLTINKRFEKLAVEVRSLSQSNLQLNPQTVDVVVSGPKGIVKDLKSEEVIPFIRLTSGIKSGDQATLEVDLPEGISLVSATPDKISLIEPAQTE